MLPDGRRLGAHLPLGMGMVRAVDRAREIGASAIQIFGDNPTAWRRRMDPPREQAAFRLCGIELKTVFEEPVWLAEAYDRLAAALGAKLREAAPHAATAEDDAS